jgi:predicted aspartyl protease
VFRPPVPGEAPIDPKLKWRGGVGGGVVLRNVSLASLTAQVHADAMLDTGAAVCIVPPGLAAALGYNDGNRIAVQNFQVVGGGLVPMNLHRLQSLRVGTAEAYNVLIAAAHPGPAVRFVLLGMSFMERFSTTTVDLDGGRVLFRAKRDP